MTSINLKKGARYIHHCGGSVITDNFILTAAHCVTSSSMANLKLIFGTNYLQFVDEHRIERLVKKIIIHPQYNTSNHYPYYDIGK